MSESEHDLLTCVLFMCGSRAQYVRNTTNKQEKNTRHELPAIIIPRLCLRVRLAFL